MILCPVRLLTFVKKDANLPPGHPPLPCLLLSCYPPIGMLPNPTNQFIKLSDGDLQCEWNLYILKKSLRFWQMPQSPIIDEKNYAFFRIFHFIIRYRAHQNMHTSLNLATLIIWVTGHHLLLTFSWHQLTRDVTCFEFFLRYPILFP